MLLNQRHIPYIIATVKEINKNAQNYLKPENSTNNFIKYRGDPSLDEFVMFCNKLLALRTHTLGTIGLP